MPEAEEALVGGGAEPERDAVHPRAAVLHPDREAELVRAAGLEAQPVADLAGRPPQPAGDGEAPPAGVTAAIVGRSQRAATSSLISNEPSGMPLTRLRKVARSATRKSPAGIGLPEHAARLAAVRDRQHPAAAGQEEVAHRPGLAAASPAPATARRQEARPRRARRSCRSRGTARRFKLRPSRAALQKGRVDAAPAHILSPGKAPEPMPFRKDRP